MNNKAKGFKLRCEIVDYLVKELKFNDFHGTTTPCSYGMDEDLYAILTLSNDDFAICVRESEGVDKVYDDRLLKIMNEENVPDPNIITNKHIDKVDIFSILHELGHRHNDLTIEYERDYDEEVINLEMYLRQGLITEDEMRRLYRRIPQERDADLYACNMMKNKGFMRKLCKYINEKNIV